MGEVLTRCEKHEEVTVLYTKLDILIEDFREAKEEQKVLNREIREHNQHEDRVQAELQAIVKWHSTIGSFVILCTMSYGVYINTVYKEMYDRIRQKEAKNLYYDKNRAVIIEIIEGYKKGKERYND